MVEWRDLPTEWKTLPDGTSGVYFLVEGDVVAYIGRSKCLRKRLRVHLYTKTELRSGRWVAHFYRCSVEESKEVERECIRHYCPPINIAHRPKNSEPPILDSRSAPLESFEIRPKPSKRDDLPNFARVLRAWRACNYLSLEEAGQESGLTAEEFEAAEMLGVKALNGAAVAGLITRLF